MLTQNSELRKDGIYNWTLPAFVVRLSNGKAYNACPNAGVCALACYARAGSYNFGNVKAAHVRNLERTLFDLEAWESVMAAELSHKRYAGGYVRIHDAGDFHSDPYTAAWLRIIRATPAVTFYAYTKEVERFKRLVEPTAPENFRWLYSYGGKQDSLIGATDRVADVFPSFGVMADAGYSSQNDSDLQAIHNENPKVGIPYNNIPHLKKQLAGRTFQEWQAADDAYREAKKSGVPIESPSRAVGRVCGCGLPFSSKPGLNCKEFGHAAHVPTVPKLAPSNDLFSEGSA